MEIIVLIIIIVAALVSKSGKNGQPGRNAGGTRTVNGRTRITTPAAPAESVRAAHVARAAKARPRVVAAQPRVATPIAPTLGEATAGGASLAEADRLVPEPLIAAGLSEGESTMPWEIPDEEGCVGGSMAHEHTEGESAEEHGAHIEEMRLRDAQEEESARAALGEIDAQALRRAVIAAEVLGRPKALKRR